MRSPGFVKTRKTSTQPTPTSAAILTCDLSISQPHRFAQNEAKPSANSGTGPRYPRSE